VQCSQADVRHICCANALAHAVSLVKHQRLVASWLVLQEDGTKHSFCKPFVLKCIEDMSGIKTLYAICMQAMLEHAAPCAMLNNTNPDLAHITCHNTPQGASAA
jgi:hypothetical protein